MINLKAKEVKIVRFGSRPAYDDESLEVQFDKWKEKHPDSIIVDMQYQSTASSIFLHSLMVIYK